jgi:hypothetical protein
VVKEKHDKDIFFLSKKKKKKKPVPEYSEEESSSDELIEVDSKNQSADEELEWNPAYENEDLDEKELLVLLRATYT